MRRSKFQEFINTSSVSGCHEWTGKRAPGGYGQHRVAKRWALAHRTAWTLAFGPIPDGMLVLHHCDNPGCVKTEGDEHWPNGHLFLGTAADNMRDKSIKGRVITAKSRPGCAYIAKGELHGNARLTEAKVRLIREYHTTGESTFSLARRYNVTRQTISQVVNRATWRHIL